MNVYYSKFISLFQFEILSRRNKFNFNLNPKFSNRNNIAQSTLEISVLKSPPRRDAVERALPHTSSPFKSLGCVTQTQQSSPERGRRDGKKCQPSKSRTLYKFIHIFTLHVTNNISRCENNNSNLYTPIRLILY